jgi:hypothetical protein
VPPSPINTEPERFFAMLTAKKMSSNKRPEFSTISVDKTVQKPPASSLTMLFQKKFLSSLIHASENYPCKSYTYKYTLDLLGNS